MGRGFSRCSARPFKHGLIGISISVQKSNAIKKDLLNRRNSRLIKQTLPSQTAKLKKISC